MTRDFYDQFRDTCEAEGVPYVIAMQVGAEGKWVGAFDCSNHVPCVGRSKEEDLLAMLKVILTGEDEATEPPLEP